MLKVKLSGNMFGETYHVAAAMLLTSLLPDGNGYCNKKISVEQDPGGTPLKDSQNTFINYCAMSIQPSPLNDNIEISKAACTESIIAPVFKKNWITALSIVQQGFWFNQGMTWNDFIQAQAVLKWKYLDIVMPNLLSSGNAKAVIWIRNVPNQSRNMTPALINQIITTLGEAAQPVNEVIFVGDKGVNLPAAANGQIFYNLIEFYANPNFKEISGAGTGVGTDFDISTQLLLFFILYKQCNVKMIIGMKSGAMDGPALIGCPMIFFDEYSPGISRMGTFTDAIPWVSQVLFDGSAFNSAKPNQSTMPPATIQSLQGYINHYCNIQ